MKKTDKKTATKKTAAKRISQAQKNRDAVQTKSGAVKLAIAKERSNPNSPKRHSQTEALHSDTATAHMETGKSLTASAIAGAVSQAVQGYDFSNDGYTPEAMRAVFNHLKKYATIERDNIIRIPGIMSRNDKAGDLSALAYWSLWSAKQYKNNPTESRSDSMNITIKSLACNGNGINHIRSAKGKAKFKSMNLI